MLEPAARQTTSSAPRAAAHLPRRRSWIGDYLGLLIALVALIAIFGATTRHFLSPDNFRAIANQIPAALLVATGMTYVLVIAEIDLSVGSVLGLCSSVMGVSLAAWHWPLWLAVVAALFVGLLCAAINASIALRWRLPTFIVTLGMLEMARGGAHAVTGSRTQYLGSVVDPIAATHLLGLSAPFLLTMVVVVLAHLVLTRTVFGRYMIAVGTNAEAVRLSGIDPHPIKWVVFLVTGLLVGLAAAIDTSRFQSANPNAGTGFELQAIAAAVIGGTSLMGGRGSIIGTFLGVVLIAVLNSGLAAVGARDETKRLVTGAVIIAAVVLDQYRHHFRKGSTS